MSHDENVPMFLFLLLGRWVKAFLFYLFSRPFLDLMNNKRVGYFLQVIDHIFPHLKDHIIIILLKVTNNNLFFDNL